MVTLKKVFVFIILVLIFSCKQTENTKTNNRISKDTSKIHVKEDDTSKPAISDKEILEQFFNRRQLFDNFIKGKNIKIFTCPGCGYPTLNGRGMYEICAVCNWEDDGQDQDEEQIIGTVNSPDSPNGNLSLKQNRINIGWILEQLAKKLNGQINNNPEEVLLILKNHGKKMDKISHSIFIDTSTLNENKDWKNWDNAKKTLLVELIKTNNN